MGFPVGKFTFLPLVTQRLNLIAALQIHFLRRQEPRAIVSTGGDIDNRIKTLLDALRVPSNVSELLPNDSPNTDEYPFYCLLEDE